MEKKPYISCIKINGVPIIPPMMTDDIREEMKHYRYLAVNLEEKLKTFNNKKLDNRMKCADDMGAESSNASKAKLCDTDVDESLLSDSDTDSIATTPNVETVIYMPMCTPEDPKNPCHPKSDDNANNSDAQGSIHSDDNTSSYSESVTMNIDLNDYSNVSNVTPTNSDTTETRRQIWKPKVPKSLDIVPITLESSPNRAKNDVAAVSNETEEAPKLTRQGSYVLDTPSPMLLAHMQTEMVDNDFIPNCNYVPTPSTAVRRKEWNITQAKSEWENDTKSKEFIIANSTKVSEGVRCCGGVKKSSSPSGHRTGWKSFNQQKRLSRQSLTVHQAAKSADCIQAMLAKEYISKSNDQDEKTHALSRWTTNRNVSIFNLANRFGGSLGSLEDSGDQLHNDVQRKCNIKRRVQNNCESKLLNDKPQMSITSEKLLNVFKEIEEMHKKQMIDLVARQQKEQSLLQEEFEKQQTRVLMEIRKSFPDISTQKFSESFTHSLVLDEKDSASLSNMQSESENVTADVSLDDCLGSMSNQRREENNRLQRTCSETSPCLLDYLYAKKSSHLRLQQGRHESTQAHMELRKPIANGWTENLNSCKGNSGQNYDDQYAKYADPKENKFPNVSRQLFPLDTKTVHLPVLDRCPVYTEKHVKAATVINAYTKGYLVRRMMQTKRVISLKNTYQDAIVCTLKLHADAPLKLPELNFLRRLELQCDAASMNIVELFAQSPAKRMQVIAHDREIKRSRTTERPTSARSYSFATQRTLARKKLKEMGSYQLPGLVTRSCSARSRCQTWTSDIREKPSSTNLLHQSIKRSTSAGTMRKPWR